MMLERLELIDRQWMLFLNGFNSPLMDEVMHYVSEPLTWLPIFIFVLFYVFKSYGLRGIGFFLLATGLCILLNDRISVVAFKNVFERYRPCHNGEIGDMIHIVGEKCGGQYGFVSSHASNFFGLAMLFGSVLKNRFATIFVWMLFWAALVGYSRIYLGVHYPFDVIGGAMLGIVLGGFSAIVFKLLNNKYGS